MKQFIEFFDKISQNLRNFEPYKKTVKENCGELLNMIQEQEFSNKIISLTPKHVAAVMLVLSYLAPKLNVSSEPQVRDIYYLSLTKYYSAKVHSQEREITESFLRECFHSIFINFPNMYPQLIDNYILADSIYTPEEFSASKAILCFLAYKTKSLQIVDKIMNIFHIKLNTTDYEANYDFTMMNYFKGIIFLSQEKFNDASICFLMAIRCEAEVQNVFTLHQIESFKRLTFLAGIVDLDLSALINKQIIGSRLYSLNFMAPYREIKSIVNDKKIDLNDLQNFKLKHTDALKMDKTYGLFNVLHERKIFEKLKDIVKTYNKIKFSELLSLSFLKKQKLMIFLKRLTYTDAIKIQIDEMKDEIEISQEDVSMNYKIDLLKSTYQNVLSIQNELISVDFENKVEKSKDSKYLSSF